MSMSLKLLELADLRGCARDQRGSARLCFPVVPRGIDHRRLLRATRPDCLQHRAIHVNQDLATAGDVVCAESLSLAASSSLCPDLPAAVRWKTATSAETVAARKKGWRVRRKMLAGNTTCSTLSCTFKPWKAPFRKSEAKMRPKIHFILALSGRHQVSFSPAKPRRISMHLRKPRSHTQQTVSKSWVGCTSTATTRFQAASQQSDKALSSVQCRQTPALEPTSYLIFQCLGCERARTFQLFRQHNCE